MLKGPCAVALVYALLKICRGVLFGTGKPFLTVLNSCPFEEWFAAENISVVSLVREYSRRCAFIRSTIQLRLVFRLTKTDLTFKCFLDLILWAWDFLSAHAYHPFIFGASILKPHLRVYSSIHRPVTRRKNDHPPVILLPEIERSVQTAHLCFHSKSEIRWRNPAHNFFNVQSFLRRGLI